MTPASEVEILLVEDNPNDVELTLRALAVHNLADRVSVVRDGAEALAFMFAEGEHVVRDGMAAPTVVLLDLKLPRVDGLEVLRRLKEDPRTSHVPVVVLTSSRQEPDIEESYRRGVNSYIVKPVEFEGFVEALAQAGLYWLHINQVPHRAFGR